MKWKSVGLVDAFGTTFRASFVLQDDLEGEPAGDDHSGHADLSFKLEPMNKADRYLIADYASVRYLIQAEHSDGTNSNSDSIDRASTWRWRFGSDRERQITARLVLHYPSGLNGPKFERDARNGNTLIETTSKKASGEAIHVRTESNILFDESKELETAFGEFKNTETRCYEWKWEASAAAVTTLVKGIYHGYFDYMQLMYHTPMEDIKSMWLIAHHRKMRTAEPLLTKVLFTLEITKERYGPLRELARMKTADVFVLPDLARSVYKRVEHKMDIFLDFDIEKREEAKKRARQQPISLDDDDEPAAKRTKKVDKLAK